MPFWHCFPDNQYVPFLLSPLSLGWDNTINHFLIFSSHKKVMPEFECPRNLIMFAPYSSHQWSLTGEEWQPKWAWILQRSCQVSLAASSLSFSQIQLLFESCLPKASTKTVKRFILVLLYKSITIQPKFILPYMLFQLTNGIILQSNVLQAKSHFLLHFILHFLELPHLHFTILM